jgi:hypothetical protein
MMTSFRHLLCGGLRTALVLSLSMPAATAAGFDGSNAFTCTAITMSSCGLDQACRGETPDSLNAPRFLRVDVPDKTITGTYSDQREKATSIAFVSHGDGQMLLGGIDGAMTWHASIAEDTGAMALTATRVVENAQFAIVVLGACTRG